VGYEEPERLDDINRDTGCVDDVIYTTSATTPGPPSAELCDKLA
jgi:hypothetical protein